MIKSTILRGSYTPFKVGLYCSEKVCFICLNKSPSNMMKNAFLFYRKSSFRS